MIITVYLICFILKIRSEMEWQINIATDFCNYFQLLKLNHHHLSALDCIYGIK